MAKKSKKSARPLSARSASKAVKKASVKPAKKKTVTALAPRKSKSNAKASSKVTSKAPARSAKQAGQATPAHASTYVSRDHHIALATWSHGYVTKVAMAFVDGHQVSQAPGIPNHALWTLGHLAVTNGWMHSLLTGTPSLVPSSYDAMFNMGTTPHQDAASYPSFDEVKKFYDESFEQILGVIRTMNDEQLFTPTVTDSHGFVTSKIDTLAKTAWHEGWHIGQLVDLRRALGIERGY
jgi:hypothetical protein